MDEKVAAVLAAYEQRAADESRKMAAAPKHEVYAHIDDFLLPVGPETGQVLHLLITGARATRLLELGTSYGYSTVWLADAARATGGRLQTVELSPRKVEYAREQL